MADDKFLHTDIYGELIGLGLLPEQEKVIAEQLAQANALRGRAPQHYTTGQGALFGGLGDALREIGGGIQAKNALKQQQDLIEQRRKLLQQAQLGLQGQPGASPGGLGLAAPWNPGLGGGSEEI